MSRDYTNKIIELKDEGVLDRDELIRDLLNWMSESDVEEFYHNYVSDSEEDEENDGQPTEAEEWRDFDPDC